MGKPPPRPTFFASPTEFRRWLERYHDSKDELWVGFHKKATGRPSLTWPESVDEALCFGWIDGIRKTVDENSYTIRFTPRRRGSIWSAVNTRRAQDLIREGRMQPTGLEAFSDRDPKKTAIYSFERETAQLEAAAEKRFKRNRAAWDFFESQPPSYRRTILYWIASAKKEETREARLDTLIKECAAGRRLGQAPRAK